LAFNLATLAGSASVGSCSPLVGWTESYGGGHVLVEFSVVPLGKGESVSQYVAECIKIVEASGLPYRLCPMGTVVEGDYDAVMSVVRGCHMRVMGMASRVITTVKIDDRRGVTGTIDRKIQSVEEKLGKEVKKRGVCVESGPQ